jgi:hypothetical protein
MTLVLLRWMRLASKRQSEATTAADPPLIWGG